MLTTLESEGGSAVGVSMEVTRGMSMGVWLYVEHVGIRVCIYRRLNATSFEEFHLGLRLALM